MTSQVCSVRFSRFGSFGRILCVAVAGFALLGASATAMADQNGKRDRGVQFVRAKDGRQSHGQHHRGRDNHHGNRGHGHHDRGHDRHHDRGHGNGHHHHGRSHGHIDIHIGGTIHHDRHVVVHRPARPTYAQLEYQRGYADAQCAAFEAGKADAINWRPYCDTPNVCFDHVSRYYRAGYLDAYASAYREGYYAGECARQTVRLRYGSRSVRYSSSCRW